MTSITLQQVSKAYTQTNVIHAISIHVPKGSLTALLGPSGCGKSTTLRMVAGLDHPTSGHIYFQEKDVTHLNAGQRKVAMVFQNYALFPHLTVRENILFGPKARKEPSHAFNERVNHTAKLLGLSHLLDRKPSQLSGGQQQRVALGRAVISEASICLMDEPLSNLDTQLRNEMRREIRALQQQLGMTMLYVTHDQTEAMSMADQVVLLNAGKIEQHATPAEIYAKPATVFTARFIGTPPMNILDTESNSHGLHVKGSRDSHIKNALQETKRLGVRPEHIQIHETHGFKGYVKNHEYFGADTILICQLGDNTINVRAPGHINATPNDAIALSWLHEHMHFFGTNQCRIS